MHREKTQMQKYPLNREPYSQFAEGVSRKYGVTGIFLLLVASSLNGVSYGLVETPQNVAVIAGEEVTLNCRTNHSVSLRWSNAITEIYNGRQLNPDVAGYDVGKPSLGQFNLKFNAYNVSAMLYTCFEPGTEDTRSAEVIVLDNPMCDANISSDTATFICQVFFSGKWAPNITWHFDRKEDVSISNISYSTYGNRLESTLNIKFNRSRGGIFAARCHTKFVKEEYRGDATAKNVPEFNGECQVNYSDPPTVDIPESSPTGTIIGIVFACVGLAGVGVCVIILYKKYSSREKQKSGKSVPEMTELTIST